MPVDNTNAWHYFFFFIGFRANKDRSESPNPDKGKDRETKEKSKKVSRGRDRKRGGSVSSSSSSSGRYDFHCNWIFFSRIICTEFMCVCGVCVCVSSGDTVNITSIASFVCVIGHGDGDETSFFLQ